GVLKWRLIGFRIFGYIRPEIYIGNTWLKCIVRSLIMIPSPVGTVSFCGKPTLITRDNQPGVRGIQASGFVINGFGNFYGVFVRALVGRMYRIAPFFAASCQQKRKAEEDNGIKSTVCKRHNLCKLV